MDQEEIDVVLLYPTIGICWEGSVRDPDLARAYAQAYNRYIVDFCSADRARLKPVAHLSLLDPEGVAAEAVRAREAGCVGAYLSPDLLARGGRSLDDPRFDRFWATLQDLDLPMAFHVVAREQSSFSQWARTRDGGADGLFAFAFLAIEVMAAFTQMLTLGIFERYPRLRCAVLEAGSNWITAWLDRLDHKYQNAGFQTPLKLKPSEYFFRQCLISAEPDESMTAQVVERLGADYFLWASDYPHLDASFDVVRQLRQHIAGLGAEAQRKILGENAVRFYGLTA
jgi:predicted TIM-barrel fold metal-dependent hydrolase